MDDGNASEVRSPADLPHVFYSNATILHLSWLILPLISILFLSRIFRKKAAEPPSLPERIPYVSNTYQYLTDNHGFLKRAAEALKKSNIVKFNLGPVPVYLVSGSQNVQRLFRNSTGSTQLSSDKFVLMVTEKVHGVDQQDAKRWASDKTGRLKIPAPGTEDTPDDQRIWSGMHHIFTERLSRAEPTAKLAQNFTAFFGEKLEKQPLDEWKEVCLFHFLKRDMAEAAIMTLAGRRLIDKYPEFVDAMWEYDKVAMKLMYGLPTWMNPGPRKAQKKALDMMETFLQDAWDTFDWDGMEAEADWEPTFGSRLQREHAKFWKDKKFSMRSRAAQHLGIQSGFNPRRLG
ncbi:Cholesterol 7-alpha-monooxygenase [Colletotrichum sp. SAR 10_99]|nr:Cholesterol 7-alpha-monooxygenase [Colletotrichum sp. SAR 10_99]